MEWLQDYVIQVKKIGTTVPIFLFPEPKGAKGTYWAWIEDFK